MPDGKAVPCREFVLPAVHKIEQLGITPHYTELRVVNSYEGYAGTCDLMGQYGNVLAIVDFKSKRTKQGVEVEPIETHPVQIAAYAYADDLWGNDLYVLRRHGAMGVNIYISTTEVGRVDAVTYDDDKISRSFSVFQKLLALWRWRHFDPRVS